MRYNYWSEVRQRAIKEAMHVLSIDEGARGVITIIVAVGVIALLWLSGSGEAGHELLIRITATAVIVLLFPLIFVWKFVTIPPRLHEEVSSRVQNLEQKLSDITVPRIRMFLASPENGVN